MAQFQESAKYRKGYPEVKMKKLKEKALAYYQENKVPESLEMLLNKMYLNEPDDVYGYMSEYFRSLAKDPIISSLTAMEGLDSNGEKCLEVDVYCKVCGVEKMVGSASLSMSPFSTRTQSATLPSTPRSKNRKKSSPKHKLTSRPSSGHQSSHGSDVISSDTHTQDDKKIDALTSVTTHINEGLKGLPVWNFSNVDKMLEDIKQNAIAEDCYLHPSSLLVTSCAVAMAGSQLISHPLFLYLSCVHVHSTEPFNLSRKSLTPLPTKIDTLAPSSQTHSGSKSPKTVKLASSTPVVNESEYRFPMPILMVAAIGSGAGKLRIREFLLIPLPGSPNYQQFKSLENMYFELGKSLSTKYGPASCCTLPNGAYCPNLDRIEQGLDIIRDAAMSAGLECSVNIAMFIDIGADTLYDEDKQKYELVAGQWKTTDEIINYYIELLHSNRGLLGFIDPLHPKDIKGWKKLLSKLGSKCLIVADAALQKGLTLAEKSKPKDGKSKDAKEKKEEEISSTIDVEPEGDEAEKPDTLEGLSCAALTWENTLTSTLEKAAKLKACSQYILMRAPPNLTVNTTILVDLAVASHCRFIRLGAPIGITTVLFNRILRIREELVKRKLHDTAKISLFASDSEQ